MELDSYITGFVDGEGSFLVSFSKRERMNTGIEARPAFTVSQNMRSDKILSVLKDYFDCGSIRFNSSDQTFKYEVRSLNELTSRIIPHFIRYPLMSSKSEDFKKFSEICQLMERKKHLTRNGIREIIGLAYEMNNLGARRYAKDRLLRAVDEMKV
ncbi:MAG: LAGLIDADG family homing endonuclease [Patescibacteria group bacterium]|nr:LAGLIDADG family homing endonuclease [Patescibacteria group bacterium]